MRFAAALFAVLVAFIAGSVMADVRQQPSPLAAGDHAELIEDVTSALTERFHVARVDPADPLLAERVIVVSGEINEIASGIVCQKLLLLDRRDPTRPIDLYLRTNGGWVSDARAILDAMRVVRAPVNVHAIGNCESAGAMILAGATGERVAWPHAMVMVHVLDAPDDAPDSLDHVDRTMSEAFWRQHAALPEELFPMRTDRMVFADPAQALAWRIVDRIGGRPGERGLPPAAEAAPSAP